MNLPIAVIHSKMKIPSFIIERNADIGGVKLQPGPKYNTRKHSCKKIIIQSLNTLS